MKLINNYISEKLQISSKGKHYNYFPNDYNELFEIVKELINERKNDDIIDLNDIDTSKVTDMSMLFYDNKDITNIDISAWDVSNVTTMGDMFSNCINLLSTGDLSSWDVSSCLEFDGMFDHCNKLNFIGDISSWELNKNADTFYKMFSYCKNLNNIGDLNKWKNISDKDIRGMFIKSGITNLPNWYVTKYHNK